MVLVLLNILRADHMTRSEWGEAGRRISLGSKVGGGRLSVCVFQIYKFVSITHEEVVRCRCRYGEHDRLCYEGCLIKRMRTRTFTAPRTAAQVAARRRDARGAE